MNTIIPVASGKGGVGKTSMVSNLGVALAEQGKTVIVIDMDLGGSNLHTALGVKNRHAGMGSLIYKKVQTVEELVVPTEIDKLYLIPGDALLPGTANLPYFIKKKINRSIKKLTADYILIDLSSGSAYNVVDFWISSPQAVLVTLPENTAVLNAYSFLKTALFRMLYLSMPAHGEEREFLRKKAGTRIEGAAETFLRIPEELGGISEKSGEKARSLLERIHPSVILNMVKSPRDTAMAKRLEQVTQKNLQQDIDFLGAVNWDAAMRDSIQQRRPLIQISRHSPFEESVQSIAQKLIAYPNLADRPRCSAGNLLKTDSP